MEKARKPVQWPAVLAGMVVLALGALWVWFEGRTGDSPPIWAYIVLGVGAFVTAAILADSLMEGASQNAVAIFLVLATGGVVVGGWFWARGQVGPIGRSVAAACEGKGVPEAGAFSRQRPGPYHIYLLDEEGGRSSYTGTSADWSADTVEDTELVACINDELVLIQTCSYTGGARLERKKNVLHVRVVVARTGHKIGSFDLTDVPGRCPQANPPSSLDGEVAFETLSEKLQPYSEGRTPGR
jgi:hypothetical protein